MTEPRQIRVGGTTVTFEHGRRFLFKDAHHPERFLTMDAVDAVDLIVFLHEMRETAQEKMDLVWRSGSGH